MPHEDDTPLSDEELALAKKGEALIAAAVADTQAPQSLRESIERDRERAQAPPRAPFWRRPLRGSWRPTATAAAALAAVVVATQAGQPSRRTVAGRGPRGRRRSKRPGRLRRRAVAIRPSSPPASGRSHSPTGSRNFGWKAVGSREDEISGRTVKTVFYRNAEGAQLGYSIVAGEPLARAPTGTPVTHAGNTYHVAHAGEHTLVTWTQQGHTCTFVASSTVPQAKLVELAASRNV